MTQADQVQTNVLPQRINVIGTSGSGKTTVAQTLASVLDIAHIELDALSWKENWVKAPQEELRNGIEQATRGGAWVVDGNYSDLRDIVWPRCDTVVWLDYSFFRVFSQLIARTVRRIVDQQELWNGNREEWRTAVFSRESILLWAIQTHWRRKRSNPVALAHPDASHLKLIRLRSRRQTRRWLETLEDLRRTSEPASD